jgi:hypothetical protein
MGFEAPRTIYTLDFDGTDLEGLIVRMRAGKLGMMLDPTNATKVNFDLENPTREDVEAVRDRFAVVAAHLVSWNLTENGRPVPPTFEGMLDQEPAFIGRIFDAWQRAQVDVPAPLSRSSSSSPPPDLSSIPMEALAGSLPS